MTEVKPPLTPESARNVLRHYYATVSDDRFVADLQRHAPELLCAVGPLAANANRVDPARSQGMWASVAARLRRFRLRPATG